MTDTADWWAGHLAAHVKASLAEPPEKARSRLAAVLARFRASPVCTHALEEVLRNGPPAKISERPADEFDLGRDWKPCLNPECRAPIRRSSRKDYCERAVREHRGGVPRGGAKPANHRDSLLDRRRNDERIETS